VIAKEVKMRKDSIEEFKKGNRADLVEQAEQEVAVLLPYLPQQMSEEEVRQVVADTIAEVGATSPKEMGKVMSALMPKVKGRADGKLVNTIVRELLQK
ncbi:MAG: GatB/YqeY domain-containing protein, partial [Selenomonadales bacterium]|nr:GatB/YqeY domain-containing protein [Selenomonadales bacterium]